MTYELEPQGEAVKLTVIHEIDKPDSKFIEAVSNGWPHDSGQPQEPAGNRRIAGSHPPLDVSQVTSRRRSQPASHRRKNPNSRRRLPGPPGSRMPGPNPGVPRRWTVQWLKTSASSQAWCVLGRAESSPRPGRHWVLRIRSSASATKTSHAIRRESSPGRKRPGPCRF